MQGRTRRETFAERRLRRAEVDDPEVVLEAAARFLEARARSVAEVRRRLTSAGYRTELVEGAIARLVDLGMLDDAAFAKAWIESRDRARPRGERALSEELRLRGVGLDVVAAALEERRAGAAAAGEPDE
ncbi:MAG TPA: regulatory protein RecX, partial [Candidatus Limnocylindrales bacterium]|nr:regulatory protein RecX [Candidatus Limnocylindrales bacterium]